MTEADNCPTGGCTYQEAGCNLDIQFGILECLNPAFPSDIHLNITDIPTDVKSIRLEAVSYTHLRAHET